MLVAATKLPGVFTIDVERRSDERGFFARTWCGHELAGHGIAMTVVQGNVSSNPRLGTLRGLHYQAAPHEETKVVRCTRGAIYDVVVDLRPASPTCGQWLGLELTAANYRQLLVPAGCAHGFLTLEPDTDVSYLMSAVYEPRAARGLRWDDPAIGVRWPIRPQLVSASDLQYPDWPPPWAEPGAARSPKSCGKPVGSNH
ncbi:dTDP-4-dehydrorhamnose 3,5-epimerase [Hymenobacter sp. IS2118]|uniref:dTDP-4-dehydrorhamnose 3,5-epimerase n=1 Tax=Hymenobacter sp. IS2118 TaxID=1505605 RepID=UPI000907082E|nr:dTDP-4-dehydrorhamnose 3,5-epimerase [Hymenobacter sp. IS2118]